MRCQLEQIQPDAWQCRRCGRRVQTMRRPDGSVVQPRFDQLPPCGWKPLVVESGGHLWVEQPPPVSPPPAAGEGGLPTDNPAAGDQTPLPTAEEGKAAGVLKSPLPSAGEGKAAGDQTPLAAAGEGKAAGASPVIPAQAGTQKSPLPTAGEGKAAGDQTPLAAAGEGKAAGASPVIPAQAGTQKSPLPAAGEGKGEGGQTTRRFRCQQCFQEITLPGQTSDAQARQALAQQAACPRPRPQPPAAAQAVAPQSSGKPPSLLQQAVNYSKAMLRWFAAGRPTRPPEEIDRILAICQTCQFYQDGHCRICGCRVTGDPQAWRNKIAMATESCPRGKWTESPAPLIQRLDLKNFVDRVYVINLRRRPDRLKTFLERLDRYGWPFKDPIIYPAIEGDVVGVPPEFTQGGGAYGCRMSHLRILQDCLMEGVNTVMILEDDAEITEGFPERVEEFLRKVPDDWQGIMLGGQHHAPPKETGIPGVVRVQYAQRTHAYIARREYMKALQRRWGNATVHIDWLMKDWQHQQIVYAPDPWLIGQAGGRSDIRGAVKPTEWWTPKAPRKPAALPPGPRPILVLRADRPVAEELMRRGWHMGYWRDDRTGYDNGLRDIASKPSREERVRKLTEWARLLWSEAEEAGSVVAVWHPGIDASEVQAAWSGPVIEIHATTPEEAEEQVPEPWRTFLMEYIPPNQPPVVILNAPDEVASELAGRGWQCVRVPAALLDRPEAFRRWLVGRLRESARSGRVLALYGDGVERLPPLPERVEKQAITGHSAEEVMGQFLGGVYETRVIS